MTFEGGGHIFRLGADAELATPDAESRGDVVVGVVTELEVDVTRAGR